MSIIFSKNPVAYIEITAATFWSILGSFYQIIIKLESNLYKAINRTEFLKEIKNMI